MNASAAEDDGGPLGGAADAEADAPTTTHSFVRRSKFQQSGGGCVTPEVWRAICDIASASGAAVGGPQDDDDSERRRLPGDDDA
eukprot:CAMPEP_0197595398 /NCGR_PEP_ID=MMETSP1326-20131121/22797_1 /TAXON_ID=1155430 /ORGANISM="Genus nov. species nov., Strain RCC2288" /LENGTH=83 /DNA_ID=CAMNT_0043161753 /DNA_START=21 /DNA_END=269 /DNA_ORIENTATION=+